MGRALIVGKPNSGKSLLFNRLTGLRQGVANFAGATVDLREGDWKGHRVVDFPGTYSLINAVGEDEKLAIEGMNALLKEEEATVLVCCLDVMRPRRSLILSLQAKNLALQHQCPIVFVCNMMDEAKRRKASVDVKGLQERLLAPVFALSAKTGQGVSALEERLLAFLQFAEHFRPKGEVIEESQILKTVSQMGKFFGPGPDTLLMRQNKLDRFFLNGFFGGAFFFLVMAFFFQSIFTWSVPLMDFVESAIGLLGHQVAILLPHGLMKDFVTDAVFGGFGSFLVFVPQIMVLTFILGLLEESGYLSRAVVILHRPLSKLGLTGKSFIPYLSGFACALPAILSARTIESPRKRLLTILTIPLIPCSARLPVYSLLISVLIPATPFLGGFMTFQGLAFCLLFAFGLFLALLLSTLFDRFAFKEKENASFIVELPPYRRPSLRSLFMKSFHSAKSFIVKAGPIIFIINVLVWILGYFPYGPEGTLEQSWLASLGHFVEPVFSPLGLDWRYTVAILASFIAREVFVSTLGTLMGMEGESENIVALSSQMTAEGVAFSTGVALLVFYAIALQCTSTVALMSKETGKSGMSWGLFVLYFLLAYVVSLVTKILLESFV